MRSIQLTAALLAAATFTSAASAQVTLSRDSYKPQARSATGLPFAAAARLQTPVQPFQLKRGVPIHEQITDWATQQGWTLIWHPGISWTAIGDASFSEFKDVTLAVSEVIAILRDEGKPVRLHIAEGNRIMEVVDNEIRSAE